MACTVGEKLNAMPQESGLWPDEAGSVIEMMRVDESAKPLADVLHKDWKGYPVQFHAAAWMTAKSFAVKYIDANRPLHFARPMFADNN